MQTGIHHVTGITANVQANVDFYAGFLGLSLVKQTGGYEDAEQLHLFYGDKTGAPGTLVSFLVWEDAGRGRTGLGQVSELAFAVPSYCIGEWLTKSLAAGLEVTGPSSEFGAPVLRLKDPDGMILKLVGVASDVQSPTPLRIHGVTLLSDQAEASAEFLGRFGYRETARDGSLIRLTSDTDIVDVRGVAGFVPSISGAGVPDHVAFRAADLGAVQQMRIGLKDYGPTSVHDRKYFLSLYVREPGGTLIEYATDAPGMGVDEPMEALGQILMIPPEAADRSEDLRASLPQFARPGDYRMKKRELPFIHRIHQPETPDGSVMILLHGTGGNEADLMPLARRVAPHAVLVGVRGRSTEEGINRWFRRFDAVTYDQEDIAAEADAFEGFIEGAVASYGLDPAKTTYLGYSNGANFIAALMQLKPGVIKRAALLRAVQALDPAPADYRDAGAEVLMLTGRQDMFGRMAPALEAAFKSAGADLTSVTLEAGHGLEPEDLTHLRDWLSRA